MKDVKKFVGYKVCSKVIRGNKNRHLSERQGIMIDAKMAGEKKIEIQVKWILNMFEEPIKSASRSTTWVRLGSVTFLPADYSFD